MKFVESIIQKNGGCYVATNKPSYADLLVASTASALKRGFFDHVDTTVLDDGYPGITATCKAIEDNEQIKAYKASKEKK